MCGYLSLPNGANGTVLLSVGSCAGIVFCFARRGSAGPGHRVGVLKDAGGAPLYTKEAPATFVIGCDKSLCSNGGVPSSTSSST